MSGMTRFTNKVLSITVDGSAVVHSQVIPFAGYAGGRIYVPAGSSLTSLTFYDAPSTDGDFIASYDDAGTPAALTLTVSAGKSYPIPAKLFGAGAIKILGDSDGIVHVCLKG